MKYKTTIIFLTIIQIISSQTKTPSLDTTSDTVFVYKEGNVVSPLTRNIYNGPCDDCYVLEKYLILGKEIVFMIPVEQDSTRFEKKIVVKKEVIDDNNLKIRLDLISSSLNYMDFYIERDGDLLIFKERIKVMKESYKREIGEEDYDHVDAIKICKKVFNERIRDTLNGLTNPLLNFYVNEKQESMNCQYCILENEDFQNCLEENNIN